MKEIFTVGHSNHTIEHFIGLLTTHSISAIADVRSSPYSEYSPQFNREIIQQRLRPDVKITHILPDGSLESHEEAEQRLIRLHKLQPELFGELTSMSGLIERAYDIQAEQIAYKRMLAEA